jgi:sirohydrochlorin ferrochelatase
VAHGSPDPRHARTMRGLSEHLTRRGVLTDVAYLEHDQPSLHQWLVRAPRASTVSVLGLFLSPGLHARDDLPRLLAQASTHVRLDPRGFLGVGPWLGGVLDDLVAATGAAPSSRVVLVTAGSARTAALAPFEDFAGRWAAQRPGPVTLVHSPGEVGRAPRDSVVVPLMVAPGVLADRVGAAAVAAGLPVTGTLSTSEVFTDALVARLRPEGTSLTPAGGRPARPGGTARGSTSSETRRPASPG